MSVVGYNGEEEKAAFTDETAVGTSSPVTGDNNVSVFVYAALMMLCAGAFVTVRRRKER